MEVKKGGVGTRYLSSTRWMRAASDRLILGWRGGGHLMPRCGLMEADKSDWLVLVEMRVGMGALDV